jgi:hypothetical protein
VGCAAECAATAINFAINVEWRTDLLKIEIMLAWYAESGSDDNEGLEKSRELVKKIQQAAPYAASIDAPSAAFADYSATSAAFAASIDATSAAFADYSAAYAADAAFAAYAAAYAADAAYAAYSAAYAAYSAAYADDAAFAAARMRALKGMCEIVRRHYPSPPEIGGTT